MQGTNKGITGAGNKPPIQRAKMTGRKQFNEAEPVLCTYPSTLSQTYREHVKQQSNAKMKLMRLAVHNKTFKNNVAHPKKKSLR